ncbi:MAG: hypothetical protein Q4E28_04990 [Clostridia bacterium]|nr:hypothetical protein [Clostridia bacterium]
MSNNFRFKLNRRGVRELLRSAEMMAVTDKYANKIKNNAGSSGYEVSNFRGKNRVNSSVRASTKDTIKDNLENNTLLKAVRK